MKHIPSVKDFLEIPTISSHKSGLLAEYKTKIIREVLTHFRKSPDALQLTSKAEAMALLVPQMGSKFEKLTSTFPKRVINGTGIHIHTNLGRAPLGKDALESLPLELSGYTNLEFDTKTSKRGSRDENISEKIKVLTGAESALVVNNAASALFLILNTLSKDKSVIISRGELVEIGGSFRIPDIIESAGCQLKEVGTTNKTHLRDYQQKLNKDVTVVLKVHQSNFVQTGFVNSVSLSDLAKLTKNKSQILVDDNGSGLLNNQILTQNSGPHNIPGHSQDVDVKTSLKQGSQIVCFSGDKLLGGIQSGFIVGKKTFIQKMRKNPLYRILRLDKVRMSLIDYNLRMYLTGNSLKIPLWKSFHTSVAELKKKSAIIPLKTLQKKFVKLNWTALKRQLGGGSDPEQTYDSWGLVMQHKSQSSTSLKHYFLNRETPIAGYIKKDTFIIDISSFASIEFNELNRALNEV